MNLNLTDPQSIVRWWRSFPERHWLQLAFFEQARPQFRDTIRSARRCIESDPMFNRHQIEVFAQVIETAPPLGDEDVVQDEEDASRWH